MRNRSKSAWTIALTLASVALVASAGAQAQGKSAGKGQGAEKAQAAWTAPGHVNNKGNGHENHKGNGYGHGPHEGLPAGCYAAAAVVQSTDEPQSGAIMDVAGVEYAYFSFSANNRLPGTTTWNIDSEAGYSIFTYDIDAYSSQGAKKLLDSKSEAFETGNGANNLVVTLSTGEGNYTVEIILGLCDTSGSDGSGDKSA